MLQNTIDAADFLDVFAGSGSMGLEALSRGAKRVVFIDKAAAPAKCIRSNLKMLGARGCVIQKDAFSALKHLEETFDIIYLDPPYDLEITPLLELIPPLVKREGTILVEQSSRVQLKTNALKLQERRIFGDSALYRFCLSP